MVGLVGFVVCQRFDDDDGGGMLKDERLVVGWVGLPVGAGLDLDMMLSVA